MITWCARQASQHEVVLLTYLDGCQNDASVDVLKLWYDSFADVLTLLLVYSVVSCERREDGNTTPFRAFVQCD